MNRCTYLLPIRRRAAISYATNLFVQNVHRVSRSGSNNARPQAYEDFGLCMKTALFFSVPILPVVIGYAWGLKGLSLYLLILFVIAISLVDWHFTRGGHPFGDKILSKEIGRDWIGGGRIAAEAAARQPNE